jgi:hypothetical protein
MAGKGFRTFVDLDILTAEQVNDYLMAQAVMVFDDDNDRSTQLGVAVAEGMVSYRKDTKQLEKYQGTSWVDITADSIAKGLIDAKGDLIVGTADNTPARLAVGTNGQVLTADSTASTGLAWATAPAGGKVLQVVSATKTDTFTMNSTTFADVTGITATITPATTGSKILVLVHLQTNSVSTINQQHYKILRGGTDIAIGDAASNRTRTTMATSSDQLYVMQTVSMVHVDSPNTTSATTYKVQVRSSGAGNPLFVNRTETDTDSAVFPRTASSITLMEIAA